MASNIIKTAALLVVILLFTVPASAVLINTDTEAEITLSTEHISSGSIDEMVYTDFIPESTYDFHFVRGSKDIADGSDFDAIRSAFSTWVDLPNSDISYNESSTDPSSALGQNYRNEISWVDSESFWNDQFGFSSSTIAVTLTWYMPGTMEVVERDIYFNDINMDWYTDTSSGDKWGKFFVEQIALHEIGHIFGLKDVYDPGESGYASWMGDNNQELTMHGFSYPNNEDVTLSQTDIIAIAIAHPAVPEPQAFAMFSLAAGLVLVRKKQ